MACAKNPEQRLLAGQATLRQSLTLSEDTIIWSTGAAAPGLTIDSEEAVTIDFGGAFVQSSTFGESPEKHQGLAILLLRAPSVTIRNATFCGFQTGILAEAVGKIRLENIRFVDFHRGSRTSSVGLQLKQAAELNVEQCLFQHLDQAFQLDAPVEIDLIQTDFHWLNGPVLTATVESSGRFIQNNFFYIGNPAADGTPAFTGGDYTFRENKWAHVLVSGLPDDMLSGGGNLAAYQPELEAGQWSTEAIERELREIGVSAPGLRLRDKWGWYDFSYPKAWLREQTPEKDIYLLTAPNGNWRLIGGEGYNKIVPKTGSFPTTLQAFRPAQAAETFLTFEYLGKKFRKYGVHPAQTTSLKFGFPVREQ